MNILNLIKALMFISIITMLISCGGAEGRKAKYLASGKNYLEQNNLEKAKLEFKNVLQIDPKSADGHYYMAQVNEKSKNYHKALGGYNKTLEFKADYVEAFIGIARIYLMANIPSKVLEFSDKALAIESGNLDATAVRAGALYRTGETDKALKNLLSVLVKDPDHLSSIALLSRIYQSSNQTEKAVAILNASLGRNSDHFELQLLLVQLYSDDKQFSKATGVMSKLVNDYPEKLSFRLKLAYFYDVMDEKSKAESILHEAVKDMPENMDAKRNLIQYLAEKRDIMFAQVELAAFIKEDESNPELQLISAALYRQMKDNNKAEAIYREIIRKYGDEAASVKSQYELARLLLVEKRIDDVKDVLEKLLKSSPNHNEGLTLRGMLSLSDGDIKGSIADFRSVLKDQPESVKHLKLLAEAYTLEGQYDLAEEKLKAALQLKSTDVISRIALAKIFHKSKQYPDAVEQLDVVLKIEPENGEAKGLMFKAFLADKNFAQALQLAQQLEKDQPENGIGYFYHGLVLQMQQKLDASMLEFEKALKLNPEAIEPLSAFVRAALALKQPAKAEAKLKSAVKHKPDHEVAQNLLGEVYLQQNKYKQASQSFEKTISINDKWWIPYRNLASAQILLKQPEQAILTYRKAMEKAEQSGRLITRFAALLEQLNKVDEAIKLYENVLVAKPESLLAANNLALLLVEHRDDQFSKDRALLLVEKFQLIQDPIYLDTLGWVHYKRGEYVKALSALLNADKLAPEQSLIHYHLGSVYFSKGDKAEARKFLTSVSKLNSAFQEKTEVERMLLSLDKA